MYLLMWNVHCALSFIICWKRVKQERDWGPNRSMCVLVSGLLRTEGAAAAARLGMYLYKIKQFRMDTFVLIKVTAYFFKCKLLKKIISATCST